MIDLPLFSIVIPTYQRPSKLARCLQAIAKLNYPKDNFEVIVVNDGGEIEEEILFSICQDLNFTILRQDNSGPATARNYGAKSAKNEFLAFTDDDCEPDPEWLIKFAEQIKLSSEDLIGGFTVNAIEKNIFSASSQMLVTYLYDYGEESNPDFTFFTSNNMTVSRSKFLSLGGFEESFTLPAAEDRDFCSRWKEANNQMFFLKTAIVHHHHNLSLKEFWRQHFNYGRGAYHFHSLRRNRTKQNNRIEPLKFYLKMFSFPFLNESLFYASQNTGLFFIAQCANVAGYVKESFSYSNNNSFS